MKLLGQFSTIPLQFSRNHIFYSNTRICCVLRYEDTNIQYALTLHEMLPKSIFSLLSFLYGKSWAYRITILPRFSD
jgi:hypothetical protein